MLPQPSLDENAVQERVTRRLNRYKRLLAHLLITLVLVAILSWANFQVNILVPAVVLLFIAHALWVAVYQEAKETIIHQEMERARQSAPAAFAEKPKREQHFSLKSDGELVEITDEEAAASRDESGHQTRS